MIFYYIEQKWQNFNISCDSIDIVMNAFSYFKKNNSHYLESAQLKNYFDCPDNYIFESN